MPTDPKYLREFSCFSNLSDEYVAEIARITTAVCYPPGYTLMEEGKPGDRLFFLIHGKVEVFYNIGEAGQVRVDAVSGDEVVGCHAVSAGQVYQVDFLPIVDKTAAFLFNRFTRPVADMLAETGEHIEYRRFADIGLPSQGNGQF